MRQYHPEKMHFDEIKETSTRGFNNILLFGFGGNLGRREEGILVNIENRTKETGEGYFGEFAESAPVRLRHGSTFFFFFFVFCSSQASKNSRESSISTYLQVGYSSSSSSSFHSSLYSFFPVISASHC